jgi:hypothetical protein
MDRQKDSASPSLATLRGEVLESIAVMLVELRESAQPHELSALRELELDAQESDSEEQLRRIALQAENLRAFCEKRTRSTQGFSAVNRFRV